MRNYNTYLSSDVLLHVHSLLCYALERSSITAIIGNDMLVQGALAGHKSYERSTRNHLL